MSNDLIITLPSYNEIPNVGLFLEQVTKYIGEYLAPVESFSLTSSMISNYVKKSIIKNPVKKQYDREQIADLIIIAICKTVMTLDDVQLFIGLQNQDADIDVTYENFRASFLAAMKQAFEDQGSKKAAPADTEAADSSILNYITVTVAHKVYLDNYFKNIREQ